MSGSWGSVPVPFLFRSCSVPGCLVVFLFVFCFVFGSVLALGSRGLSLFLFRSCSSLVPFLVVFWSYFSSVGGSVLFLGVLFVFLGVSVLSVFWVLVLFLVLFVFLVLFLGFLFWFLGVLVLFL